MSWRGVPDTTLCDQVTCGRSVVFSGYSINKADRHGITEILLKVALNTIHHEMQKRIFIILIHKG